MILVLTNCNKIKYCALIMSEEILGFVKEFLKQTLSILLELLVGSLQVRIQIQRNRNLILRQNLKISHSNNFTLNDLN